MSVRLFLVVVFLSSLARAADDPVVVDTKTTTTETVPAADGAAAVVTDGVVKPDETPAAATTTTTTTTDDPAQAVDEPHAVPDDSTSATIDAKSKAIDDGIAELEALPPLTAQKPAKPIADGITFSGIPAVNYIPDNGLGLGIIAAMYFNDGMTLPYRTAITLQIFASTNLVQDHNVVVDTLRVFDLPLRVTARVGYVSSLTQNYCGLGGVLPCDEKEAELEADVRGLDGVERADFVRHYYQRRFMNPYGLVNLRYALIEKSADNPRVELTGGYRGFYFIPGNIFADDDGDGAPDLTPYEGSLYAKDFPDGEPGFDSVLNLGLMTDSRDNEPAPTEGWWIEGSVRAATPLWGSTWTWAGFNATVRGYRYMPVIPELGRRLVLANRLTVDGVVGDIPIQELARLGGSQDIYAFGGADMGRGIRVQRYMGKLKILDQAELRYRFYEFDFLEQNFALTVAAFIDGAIVGDELVDPKNIGTVAGGGGAFRIAWNENFMIRLDVAASPVENYAPQIYLTINQPF
ncbi:MAG: BamA/TamA family outer membrane protein [Deltaproteobacteria bacterium]|nr:BamA/TamA family outer membrane protein [Deltaproteobacteria bacterium]